MAKNTRKLIDSDVWHSIRKENNALTDPEEREIRDKLLHDISTSIGAYETRVHEWEYKELMKEWGTHGISLEPCDRKLLAEKWDALFSVTGEMLASCPVYNDQFRWHRFSFEIIGALTDSDLQKSASDAFDKAEKSTLGIFFDCCDEAYIIKGCENLTAADILRMRDLSSLNKMDIYFLASDGDEKWTYVTTHESIGPFFCRAAD